MAQNIELREQTTVPTSSAGIQKLYVNSSGILCMISGAGAQVVVGQRWVANCVVPTGGTPPPSGGALPAMSCAAGNSGLYLGQPTNWIPVNGPSGETWGLPCYTRS